MEEECCDRENNLGDVSRSANRWEPSVRGTNRDDCLLASQRNVEGDRCIFPELPCASNTRADEQSFAIWEPLLPRALPRILLLFVEFLESAAAGPRHEADNLTILSLFWLQEGEKLHLSEHRLAPFEERKEE